MLSLKNCITHSMLLNGYFTLPLRDCALRTNEQWGNSEKATSIAGDGYQKGRRS